MRYLTLSELLALHAMVLEQTGGGSGVRDLGGLESAIAQPRMTFGGEDLYPDLGSKVAALGFSLIQNHPFVDGNKRVGHAAMETFLLLNGWELETPVDAAEELILGVASGAVTREQLAAWIERHKRKLD